MPRKYYKRSYRRTERKPLIWEPCTISANLNPQSDGTPGQLAPKTTYKLCDISLSNNADTEVILERIRGSLFWEAEGSTGASLQGVFFGIILPDIVAGNVEPGHELQNFPTPVDPEGTEDFPLVLDACAPVGGGVTTSTPVNVDVKSKRKMGKDELLTLAIHIVDLFSTGSAKNYKATIRGGLRILQKIL